MADWASLLATCVHKAQTGRSTEDREFWRRRAHQACLMYTADMEIEIYGQLMSKSIFDDFRRFADGLSRAAAVGYANVETETARWERDKFAVPAADPDILVRRG